MSGIATSSGPSTDLSALIERLNGWNGCYPADGLETAVREAAAALAQLRDSEALARGKIAEQVIEIERLKEWRILAKDAAVDCLTEERIKRERAEAEVARLTSEVAFLHKRRGEIVIDRDRYKAALGEYPEGRDVMLAGALAQMETERQRAERAEAQITHYPDCWRDHYGCAMERIKALEGERDALKAELAQEELEHDRATIMHATAIKERDALKAKLDAGCPTCAAAVRMQRLIDDRQS
jgi:chromosome segregation ATPase